MAGDGKARAYSKFPDSLHCDARQNRRARVPAMIRVSVDLVQIDAVVTDSSGKAVAPPALGVPKTNTVPAAGFIVLFADDRGLSKQQIFRVGISRSSGG
jgi:hypothetical protein